MNDQAERNDCALAYSSPNGPMNTITQKMFDVEDGIYLAVAELVTL